MAALISVNICLGSTGLPLLTQSGLKISQPVNELTLQASPHLDNKQTTFTSPIGARKTMGCAQNMVHGKICPNLNSHVTQAMPLSENVGQFTD